MTSAIDLTGERFGKLVAVRGAGSTKYGHALWLLKCDCGGETTAHAGELRAGKRRSCKCGLAKPKHGMHKTRLHMIWGAMKARCQNPKRPAFADYGGRGITVRADWQRFIPFMEWALSHGYQDDLEIDRIDNNGSYSPENCHWVTRAVNARNKRPAKPLGLRCTKAELQKACEAADVDFVVLFSHLPTRRVYH